MNAKPLLYAVLAIAAIWGAVASVMGLTDKHTSSPEKVQELMVKAPWFEDSNLDEEARRKYLDDVIAQVNRLDFNQCRQSRAIDPESGRRFMDLLSTTDRHHFLE